jgi:hypothetical protein
MVATSAVIAALRGIARTCHIKERGENRQLSLQALPQGMTADPPKDLTTRLANPSPKARIKIATEANIQGKRQGTHCTKSYVTAQHKAPASRFARRNSGIAETIGTLIRLSLDSKPNMPQHHIQSAKLCQTI